VYNWSVHQTDQWGTHLARFLLSGEGRRLLNCEWRRRSGQDLSDADAPLRESALCQERGRGLNREAAGEFFATSLKKTVR